MRFLSQCIEDTLIDMFARLRKLFRRTNVDERETRERRKGAGLSSESNEGQRRWSWRMWSKYWEVDIDLPGRVARAGLSSKFQFFTFTEYCGCYLGTE